MDRRATRGIRRNVVDEIVTAYAQRQRMINDPACPRARQYSKLYR